MKTLYFECNMGAAGDMMMAALLELVPDRDAFLAKMNALGLPGVSVMSEKAEKCGISGTHIRVTACGREEISDDVHESVESSVHEHAHSHEHAHGHVHAHADEGHVHSSLADICGLIDGMDIPGKVKKDAKAVYQLLAEAEGKVHGKPADQVHFHEVGAMDAVADITGVCLLMNEIGAEKISASAVHVGSGNVRCAHGVLPVPAPAAALLLEGVPIYGGRIKGELCTPTGAALLRYFAQSYGEMPVMTVSAIGCGMGSKDFEQANCIRVFLGESADAVKAAAVCGENAGKGSKADRDLYGSVVKLECNLDDMTGEDLGYAIDVLLKAGARDVFTQAIGMKKSRPGVLLSVICLPRDADRMAELMLRHTTTLGVRRLDMKRYNLKRHIDTLQTQFGEVRIKRSEGYGVSRAKFEYDDLARIAAEKDISLEEVRKLLYAEPWQIDE